jgi:hypothetical protein
VLERIVLLPRLLLTHVHLHLQQLHLLSQRPVLSIQAPRSVFLGLCNSLQLPFVLVIVLQTLLMHR